MVKKTKRGKFPRLAWGRKPETQVVPNKKAKEEKEKCRKDDRYDRI